jgi:hypothetical protein
MDVALLLSIPWQSFCPLLKKYEKEKRMKPLIMIGLILVLVGGLFLAYQGFTYVTHEKVIDAGPVQVTAEKQNFVYLPPILGAVTLGAGVVLMVIGASRRGTA